MSELSDSLSARTTVRPNLIPHRLRPRRIITTDTTVAITADGSGPVPAAAGGLVGACR